jgi:SAM-dependent methyltransferase
MNTTLPQRGRFEGVGQIVRFNWPFYLVAACGCLVGIAGLVFLELPMWLELAGWGSIGLGAFWTLGSLAVSWYVYDLSPLYRWQWLPGVFTQPPRRWVNIHSGLDDSSIALQQLFAPATGQVLDIYDPQQMTEPSIARARALVVPPVMPIPARHDALPLGTSSVDAVFLLFAAHELRDPAARLDFFRELKRIAAPQARLVLVEHLRDGANFIAFGPGFWHFLSRLEWLRLAGESGCELVASFKQTPFVTVFVLQGDDDDTA